jgi:hypothetical protein
VGPVRPVPHGVPKSDARCASIITVEQRQSFGDLTAKGLQCLTAFARPCTDVAAWRTLDAGQPYGIARRALWCTVVHRTADVYWTDYFNPGSVMKVALGGGSPMPIGVGQGGPFGIAVDGSSVYWSETGTAAGSFMDGLLMKTSLAGGTATTMATSQGYPYAVAVDATSLYWSDQMSGAIMKLTPK